MQFKITLKETAKMTEQKISQFCAPQNIGQLISFLIMEDSIIKEAEGKLLAAELVRCMIALSADFGAIQKGQIEIELSPYSELLS